MGLVERAGPRAMLPGFGPRIWRVSHEETLANHLGITRGRTHSATNVRCLGGLFALILLLLPIGCASVKPKSPAKDSAAATIDQINLLASPVALNFDDSAGPDGFVLKVYAGNRDRPKPVPILSGNLEVLMFDGIPKTNAPEAPAPRRTWKYSAEQLQTHSTRTSIGTGYQLSPQWGEAKPAGDKISVLVRYTSPSGVTIYSAPSVIAVTAK